jgi:SAM-dependent methyltransferase
MDRHRLDWEALAEEDALWAVLTDPARRGGGWTQAEFLATGEQEVAHVLTVAERLRRPARRASALDFGCGAGRLTRALAARFERVVGVDIAEGMLAVARRLTADAGNVELVHNDLPDLRRFTDATFDLALSSVVLQHQPSRRAAAAYAAELVRVTRPDGLVVFQLPAALPPLSRLQLSRRAYGALRRLGVPERAILRRTPLTPMRMLAVPQGAVRALVAAAGGSVLEAEGLGRASVRYYVAPSTSA